MFHLPSLLLNPGPINQVGGGVKLFGAGNHSSFEVEGALGIRVQRPVTRATPVSNNKAAFGGAG